VDKDKYLVSQKLAFLAFTVLGAIVLVTGVIKVDYFIRQFSIITTSNIHDISSELFFLLLVIHVLIVIAVPSHWRLFLSWFTGKEPPKR
jgi:cytochrome b subunit of formate dehydrogenase